MLSPASTAASAVEIECACHGTGWVPYMDGPVERVRRCQCWLERQRSYAADVPLEFQQARLENYRPMKGNGIALTAARAFLEGRGDLVLHGGVGAGKTRLACSIL